ncbi:MAG: hypothetical protein LBB75_05830, partial [Oscillospiraceae bacterium]|nr:hypothetical protein [Oscillospiraceae bacterium]
AAENNRRNLRAAHMFVAIIIGIIGLSYIFAIVYPAIACKDVKIPNEVLSILQAALFTLLGYLFGEKNSNGKSI